MTVTPRPDRAPCSRRLRPYRWPWPRPRWRNPWPSSRTRRRRLRFRAGISVALASVSTLVTLGVGGLLHGRFEFALLAENFLLLQLDLFLLLDDLHLHFFGLHELAGLEFLQIVGEVGFGFLLVHHGLIHARRWIDNRVAPRRFLNRRRNFASCPACVACEDLIIASRSASAWAMTARRV